MYKPCIFPVAIISRAQYKPRNGGAVFQRHDPENSRWRIELSKSLIITYLHNKLSMFRLVKT